MKTSGIVSCRHVKVQPARININAGREQDFVQLILVGKPRENGSESKWDCF